MSARTRSALRLLLRIAASVLDPSGGFDQVAAQRELGGGLAYASVGAWESRDDLEQRLAIEALDVYICHRARQKRHKVALIGECSQLQVVV